MREKSFGTAALDAALLTSPEPVGEVKGRFKRGVERDSARGSALYGRFFREARNIPTLLPL